MLNWEAESERKFMKKDNVQYMKEKEVNDTLVRQSTLRVLACRFEKDYRV